MIEKDIVSFGKIYQLSSHLDNFTQEKKQKLLNQIEITGAFRPNCIYKVKYPSKQVDIYLEGQIIDCRLSKNYSTNCPKQPNSYQYLIRFIDVDRRYDCWVESQMIDKNSMKQKPIVPIVRKNTKKGDLYTPTEGLTEQQEYIHQSLTKFKRICKIQLGKYISDAWYFSPFPIRYSNVDILYFCQYCLLFYSQKQQYLDHINKCPLFYPPGDQIYRDTDMKISLFQVDGYQSQVYCQNLCLLSKLFIDHKSLNLSTFYFKFYILCEIQNGTFKIVGYFSKPKQQKQINLSCILVFPFYQKKGYGQFLITMSYQLSKLKKKIGTPERPLSALGLKAYVTWWSERIAATINKMSKQEKNKLNIKKLQQQTGIHYQDIIYTLKSLGVVQVAQQNKKYYINSNHKIFKTESKGIKYNSALLRWYYYPGRQQQKSK